jgi:hypothetical protein
MQLEIKTEGVDFVVSRHRSPKMTPQPKNDNDGRQKTDRDTGAPLHVTELVAMDDTGAEVKAAYLTDEQAAGIAEHAARLRTRAALGRAMGKSEGVT